MAYRRAPFSSIPPGRWLCDAGSAALGAAGTGPAASLWSPQPLPIKLAAPSGAAFAAIVVLALVVLAAVALPFAFIFLVARQVAKFPCFPTKRLLVSEAFDTLRTCDVLLFAGATHSAVISATTQEFFSHSALVLKMGESAYTSESSPGSHLMASPAVDGRARHFCLKAGASLAPLLLRIKHYNGLCFLLRLKGPALPPEKEEAVLAEAGRLFAEAYPYPSSAHAALSFLGSSVRARHCFQHVAHLLDIAGLAPGPDKLADAGFFQTCHEVCGLPGRPLAGGRRYSKPRLLVYNIS